ARSKRKSRGRARDCVSSSTSTVSARARRRSACSIAGLSLPNASPLATPARIPSSRAAASARAASSSCGVGVPKRPTTALPARSTTPPCRSITSRTASRARAVACAYASASSSPEGSIATATTLSGRGRGGGERLALGDELGVVAERELGLEQLLASVEPERVELGGALADEVDHVRERGAAPQAEGRAQRLSPLRRRLRARLVDELLEA